MALINCPECGHRISDKAVSCPSCGCPVSKNNGISCRYCGSTNVLIQKERISNVGVAQNKVVIEKPKSSKGCLYWLIIGWWWEPIWFICFGWLGLLFGGKKKSGLNWSANKDINVVTAICQNCGKSWKL